MTWLAWRLHGSEVRFAGAMAALAAALMAVSRLVLASDASRDVKIWLTVPVLPMVLLVNVAPGLLGMFLGAPLVAAEVETGTHRLVWTQSVSRRRWLLVHAGLVLCGSIAAMAVAGAGVNWALQPLFDLPRGQSEAPTQPVFFDAIGIVPAAYAAFAVALGVLLGALTRRTVVAMFLALALFAVVRVTIASGVRPNLGLHSFWALQLVEAGIYVALGVLLLGAAWWRVTRGLT